jgi:hypothetical protein
MSYTTLPRFHLIFRCIPSRIDVAYTIGFIVPHCDAILARFDFIFFFPSRVGLAYIIDYIVPHCYAALARFDLVFPNCP